MSRAFVRESDDQPELPRPRPASALPLGSPNYLTAAGAEILRAERQALLQTERPRLLAQGDDPDAKRRLLVLAQRVEQLEQSLGSAQIVPPAAADAVRFGATVRVRNRAGEECTYRIVGVDEIDLEENAVSWVSPIARALLNAKRGDRVRFSFPSGEDELEIVEIR